MEKAKDSDVYETQNVDFASFLMLEGIKFLGCKRSEFHTNVVVLCFDDAKQSCIDLERVFIHSDYKKYRDINKWLLSKIHGALRDLPKGN